MEAYATQNRPFVTQSQPLHYGREYSGARGQIEEIERLWLEGYTTYQIAAKIGERPRDVGRNLREIKKRMNRAAQRQTQALAVSQCAAIQREAMEGWRRSQEPKCVVTTVKENGEVTAVTTRIEQQPGNCAFLSAALRAVKMVRQIADGQPDASRNTEDTRRLKLLKILTPDQVDTLSEEQVRDFGKILKRLKRQVEPPRDDEADVQPAAEFAENETPSESQLYPHEDHTVAEKAIETAIAPAEIIPQNSVAAAPLNTATNILTTRPVSREGDDPINRSLASASNEEQEESGRLGNIGDSADAIEYGLALEGGAAWNDDFRYLERVPISCGFE